MTRSIRSAVSLCALSAGAIACAFLGGAGNPPLNFYEQRNLVSDGSVPAEHTDARLVNPWGMAFFPTGFRWISDAGSGFSTLYDGNGNQAPFSVSMPTAAGGRGPSHPTGIVFNSSNGFAVSDGVNSAPAFFIFSTLEGTIEAWSFAVPPPAPSTRAFTVVPSDGAVYTGLAIGNNGSGDFIYVPDFRGRKIDVFDSTFQEVKSAGGFTDPNLPAEYAPFGIRNINNVLYVTYAVPNDAGSIVAHNGLGIVDAYDLNGNLLRRLITGGELNGPWGLALAPDDFGKFSGDLLVGNLGNGRIHAYDPITGQPRGTLLGPRGGPIEIERLWSLDFGNGNVAGPTNVLFFTAGLENERHGLFGSLTAVAPGNGKGRRHE